MQSEIASMFSVRPRIIPQPHPWNITIKHIWSQNLRCIKLENRLAIWSQSWKIDHKHAHKLAQSETTNFKNIHSFLFDRNLALISDALHNYKHVFGLHRLHQWKIRIKQYCLLFFMSGVSRVQMVVFFSLMWQCLWSLSHLFCLYFQFHQAILNHFKL